MIHRSHLRRAIRETLEAMGPRYASPAAVELLMLTAAHESRLGEFLWQHRDGQPKGPAVGIYQMEPGRWRDTAERATGALEFAIAAACTGARLWSSTTDRPWDRMAWDLRYATAMARAAYWLIPEALPAPDDVEGLARYWHRHWCRGCRGTVEQAIAHYRQLAQP